MHCMAYAQWVYIQNMYSHWKILGIVSGSLHSMGGCWIILDYLVYMVVYGASRVNPQALVDTKSRQVGRLIDWLSPPI
jgi:hypothetical protein